MAGRACRPAARVLDFGTPPRRLSLGISGFERPPSTPVMQLAVTDGAGTASRGEVIGGFRRDAWTHVAVVTGTGGMLLYLNGVLMLTNPFEGSLSALGNEAFVGGRTPATADGPLGQGLFNGQVDEVRVWSVRRTAEEIKANLFQRLTGGEPGLAGLWNFDGPDPAQAGRGSVASGGDAQISGNARSVAAELPRPGALALPGLIEGRATYPDGDPLVAARIGVGQPEFFKEGAKPGPLGQMIFGSSDKDGCYRFAVFDPPESLAVRGSTRDEELYGLSPEFSLRSGQRQEVDLKLQDNVVVSGILMALDNSPLGGMELGLAKPRAAPEDPPGEFVGPLTSTRDNGEFRFTGNRPAGRYELLAQTQRGPVSLGNGQLIDFNPQQPLTRMVFHLAPLKKARWQSFGVTEGLPNPRVQCILPGTDGTLWVGTWGGLARFDGQAFIPWEAPAPLRDAAVMDIRSDPQGGVWAFTSSGIGRFDGQQWTVQDLSADGLPADSRVFTAAWDSSGRMWVGAANGLFRFEGKRFVPVLSTEGRPLEFIAGLLAGTNGSVWIISNRRGVLHWDGKEVQPVPDAQGLEVRQSMGMGERGMAVHRDAQGVWWKGTPNGLERRASSSTVTYTKADGLAGNQVTSIAAAGKNALWVGTNEGLSRFEEEQLQILSTKDGLPKNRVTRVALAPDGSVWFTCSESDLTFGGRGGGSGDILCRYDGQAVTRYGRAQGLRTPAIGGLMVDADGAAWVGAGGTWGGSQVTGVWRLTGEKFTLPDATAEWDGLQVGAIERLPDGRLWIAAEDGARIFDGRGSRTVPIPGMARTVHGAENGDVWVGTDSGAYRWNERLLTSWTAKDGLEGRIQAIAVASKGVTWFGTDKGLFRADGASSPPRPVVVGRGPLPGGVRSLLVDRDGLLWVGTDHGVARFDGAAWSMLGEGEGLPGPVIHAIQQAADGALWFGTSGGLVRYRRNRTAPAVPVVLVQADGESRDLVRMTPLLQDRRATLRFGITDTATPASRRQYRVEIKGDGPDTSVAGPVQSEPQFDWSPPQPGTYTVSVQYIDGELNYSKPATATLTVVPPWHRNWLVMVPLVGVNLGLVGWAFSARMLYVRKRREAERLRGRMFEQEHRARLELEAKNAELAEAKAAADEASRIKSNFLANMSHELRTPMNAIIGYSEMLQEEAGDPGQTSFIPDLQKIHGAGKHLLSLINDILDLSKIEAGRMTLFLEVFDVADLVEEVAATVKPLVHKNRNHLVVDCAAGIGLMRADVTKVRQTLFNLLSNALKFTENGEVRLEVTRHPPAGSAALAGPSAAVPVLDGKATLVFRVTDTGIGITPEQMSRLFLAFEQADASTTKKFGGTGLGLAISKRFCGMMGGDITAQSVPGKGTVFTVTLPAVVEESAAAPVRAE